MPSSTKWRLRLTGLHQDGVVRPLLSGDSFGLGEVVMASSVGGVNMCTGGTPIASGHLQAIYNPPDPTITHHYPSLAFDWVLMSPGGGQFPWADSYDTGKTAGNVYPWIGYDFGTAVSVVEYGVNIGDGMAGATGLLVWNLEYWNASLAAWVPADTRIGPELEPYIINYFSVTAVPSPIKLARMSIEVIRDNAEAIDVYSDMVSVEVLRTAGRTSIGGYAVGYRSNWVYYIGGYPSSPTYYYIGDAGDASMSGETVVPYVEGSTPPDMVEMLDPIPGENPAFTTWFMMF